MVVQVQVRRGAVGAPARCARARVQRRCARAAGAREMLRVRVRAVAGKVRGARTCKVAARVLMSNHPETIQVGVVV